MVAPITTTQRILPTTVQLQPGADGVERPCTVYLDHIQSIPADVLERFVARLRPEKLREVEQAFRVAFALPEA
jgi:mRNA-degrading endonuclease toxin of MazEF toxin-antitoxin module